MPLKKDNPNLEAEIEKEEFEPSHSDKLVGVFIEPGKTFRLAALYKTKIPDWFLPLLLFVLASVLANFLMTTNTAINYDRMHKSLDRLKVQMEYLVDEGYITRDYADKRIENSKKSFEKGTADKNQPLKAFFIVAQVLLSFFLAALFYYVVFRVMMRKELRFSQILVAAGLPYYINLLHKITIVLVAILLEKYIEGFSISDIFSLGKNNVIGFVLSKFDPFSIWYFFIVATGIKKLAGEGRIIIYAAIILGSWIGLSTLVFILNSVYPLANLVL